MKTLGRGIKREQNHRALRLLREMDIHTTFNLLMFDPETTLSDLKDNISFMEIYADFPMNFGRVEAYSGTPLAERLRSQGRLLGDYFGYSYKISDERVQHVFEMFKRVFLPRNFRGDAMNFKAMRLDYYFYLLRHFRPHLAPPGLEAKTRTFIRELNRNSAELLTSFCDLVSGNLPCGDSEADALSASREAYDKEARKGFTELLEEIKRLAQPAGEARRTLVSGVAAAAAAILVVSAAGCKWEVGSWDKMAGSFQAEEYSPRREVKALSPEKVKIVNASIAKQYLTKLVAIVAKYGFGNIRVDVELTLDEKGNVSACKVTLPKEANIADFVVKELGDEIKTWAFPQVKEAGKCTLALILQKRRPDDWHICEMMMQPMD